MPFPNPSTQFQPGHPGGPGRPRTKPITDRLREALEVVGDDGRSMADAVIDRWFQMIADGEVSALREMLDRTEGMLAQALKHEHDGGLTIRVEYADGHHNAAEATPGATPDPA
jgi:hypothetical protein